MEHSNVMSRAQFEELVASLDLNNQDNRVRVNAIVIDEVLKKEWKIQRLEEAHGLSPVDTSCFKFLRPTPMCIYGSGGWGVQIGAEWFID